MQQCHVTILIEDIQQFKFRYDTVDNHSQCVPDPPTPPSLSNQMRFQLLPVNTTVYFPRRRIMSVNNME